MGCCCCGGDKKQEYETIPENDNKGIEIKVSPKINTKTYSNSSSSSHTSSTAVVTKRHEETVTVLTHSVKEPVVVRPKTPPAKPKTPPPIAAPVEDLIELDLSPIQPTSKPNAVNPHTPSPVNAQPTTPLSYSASPTPAVTPGTTQSDKPYDENLSVYKGTLVEQKFSNKSSYDTKFAWVNFEVRSLNLSEHMTKERRHKEASLVDVIKVVKGAPEKFRAPPQTNGEVPVFQEPDLCLSVKFIRGGGIDLKFKTVAERDLWYDQINRLIGKQ